VHHVFNFFNELGAAFATDSLRLLEEPEAPTERLPVPTPPA
jgi:hypothetical protein